MQRRKLLKTMAAGGALSLGMAASGSATAEPGDIEELEALQVVRDGAIVRTVENPTSEDLTRMEAELGTHETLVSPQYDCSTKCCQDCFCDDCWCECECDGAYCKTPDEK